jgi:hypothetical protein
MLFVQPSIGKPGEVRQHGRDEVAMMGVGWREAGGI